MRQSGRSFYACSMQTTRRLRDADLAAAELDIEHPMLVENLSRERPDPNLTPSIIGEYHRPKTEDAIWCCHCQAHRHWNGFVVENQTGFRYLIGSHCGPKHYDLSFAAAHRQHKDLKQRQGLGRRLATILSMEEELAERIRQIFQSDGLRRVDDARLAIKKAAGDAFFRLQPIALTGGALTQSVRVRDYAAEAVRSGDRKDEAPVYTFESERIGTLEGVGLLIENGDCRDALIALRTAVSEARKVQNSGTDNVATNHFQKVVKKCEETHASAQQAIALARRAPAFFSDENLLRLERWSEQFDSFSIRRTDSGMEIPPKQGSPIPIVALKAVELSALPNFAAD